MPSKIDLHLHTIYSDGRNTLEDVSSYQRNSMLEYISITDHNTLQGNIVLWQQGKWQSQFLVGTELRLPGVPDILIYFPSISLQKAMEVEEKLRSICRLDQEITLEIAKDYIDNDALLVWRDSPHFNNQGNYWLGTLQLAQLISQRKQPPIDIIKEIRKKKSLIFNAPHGIKASRELNDIANFEWINKLVIEYNGVAVLAHPYREIMRRLHKETALEFASFKAELENMMKELINFNIKTFEHITVYSRYWWEQHCAFSTMDANNFFIKLCRTNKLNLTVGSDSHDLSHSDDIIPSMIDNDCLSQFLPAWLR